MSTGATRKQQRSRRGSRVAGWLRPVLGTGGLLAGVVLVAMAGWKLAQLPVEQVVFTGGIEHVSRERLQQLVSETLAQGSLSRGFLATDLQQLRAPLETLPWVYRVGIKRRWPSTLEIEVIEELPIARWGDASYLNHEGAVFSPGSGEVAVELPLLSGPEGSQRQLMRDFQAIQRYLAPAHLVIESLHMNERGSVRAVLVNGPELVFGRGEFNQKLERFMEIYRADLAARQPAARRVDLRYHHGMAVAWLDS